MTRPCLPQFGNPPCGTCRRCQQAIQAGKCTRCLGGHVFGTCDHLTGRALQAARHSGARSLDLRTSERSQTFANFDAPPNDRQVEESARSTDVRDA